MKKLTSKSLRFIPAALGLAVCLLAYNAQAQNQYFGVTGGIVTGGTYSWDAANWSVVAGSSGGPFTSTWTAGSFARFYGGAGDNYTVTVNAAESNVGMYLNAAGTTLNINDAGNSTGSLNVINAIQGFLVGGSYTESININVPITGNGGIAPELSGSIYLNAANSYTGGTALGDSGNTLTYFNNNLAFSTGDITLNRTGIGNFSTLLNNAGTTVALANNFATVPANTGAGTALNFASSPNSPVVSSGAWTLGTVNLNLRNAGGSTAPLTISGAIDGTGILALSANGAGSTTILSGANTFSGQVIVTGSGGTYGGSGAITLKLGSANTIANISSMVLAGGTVDPGGNKQIMSGALSLTANSTIDYEAGGALVSFADSSSQSWTGVLNLANWVGTGGDTGTDELQFGTDQNGLTQAQLNEIEINGNGATLGLATLDINGFLVIPEPSTLILGLLGGLGLLWTARRRTA